MMLDHLRSLAVFAKVAELGSFRAAARALSLSPSVVSHHVSELERRLSLPLLYRTTRKLALTADGERLRSSARDMVEAAERGIDALSGRSASPSGTLRLTAPAFLAQTSLSRDLAGFAADHPNVRLTVTFTDEPRDLLRDGLDLALRVGTLADSSHSSRKLGELRRVIVATPRYADAHTVGTPRDLATWDWLRLSSRPAETALHASGRKPVRFAYTPKISVDSAAAMREMVLAGAGVAILPEVLVRGDLARGRLVRVLPAWHVLPVGVFALWPHNAQRAGLTDRFVSALAGRMTALFAAEDG